MSFKEFWAKERGRYFGDPTLLELKLARASWDAAIDEAIKAVDGVIKKTVGIGIRESVAEKLKELKQ